MQVIQLKEPLNDRVFVLLINRSRLDLETMNKKAYSQSQVGN